MWVSVRFICFVLKHKWYVFTYGIKIGGIPLWQLLIHDLSKFSRAEFGPYIRKHATGERPEEYLVAMRRHQAHNPHHWQHWIQNGELHPMPEVYVREMVADWHGATKNYNRETLQEWFEKDYPKMILHPETIRRLVPLIESCGLRFPAKSTDYSW
jgi:hypothetical protein